MSDRKNISLPTLIIGYARFEGILEQISSISKSSRGKIYVHLDYPKSEMLLERQRAFLSTTRKKYPSVEMFTQKKNLGVAVGVLSALDWFFSHEDAGLVIEDDLRFDFAGLKFLEIGISHIEKMEMALMVAGSNFSREEADKSSEMTCRWTSIPLIWGWATTSQKWKIIKDLILDTSPASITDFLSPSLAYFQSARIKALSRKVDTWDSPLAYMMFKKNYLCLVPPVNLFSNSGNDEFASHTMDEGFPMFLQLSNAHPSEDWLVPFDSKELLKTNKSYLKELYNVRFRNSLGLIKVLNLIPKIGNMKKGLKFER
jgi:hypothetical protein